MKYLEIEIYEYNKKDAEEKLNSAIEYIYGKKKEQNLEEFLILCKKSALQGNEEAQYILGVLYQTGIHGIEDYFGIVIPQDKKLDIINLQKAIYWYEKSANQGDEVGQNNIGEMYRDGIGVEIDYKKAMDYFLKSANQGCQEAEYNIGVMYEKGLGVETSYKEALNWYEKAYINGLEKAKQKLNEIYKLNSNNK